MTRDELPNAIGKALIAKYGHYDGEADVIMPLIDQYAAAQRAEIEQQITGHVDDRLWAQRECIAQDIEAQAPVQPDAGSGYQSLRAGMIRAAAIARAES